MKFFKVSRATLTAATTCAVLACGRPPTDQELRLRFLQSREPLQELAMRLSTSRDVRAVEKSWRGVVVVTRDGLRRGELPGEEWGGLLGQARVEAATVRPEGEQCAIEFDVDSWGLVVEGWRKGYCLARVPTGNAAQPQVGGVLLTDLGDGWYLFVDDY